MIELSPDTTTLLQILVIDPSERETFSEKLRTQCADNIPFFEDGTPESLERIRFSVLKLYSESWPGTDVDVWIKLAYTDWRDLYMAAEFGHDIYMHMKWKEKIINDKKDSWAPRSILMSGSMVGVPIVQLAWLGEGWVMGNDVHLEAFAANYEVTYILRTIDPEQIYRISHDREGKSHLAVDTLQITPHGGKRWEGEFFRDRGISGAYSTPNPDVLCVVSAGEGYLVDPLRPLEFSVLKIDIQHVFQVESVPAIVFVGYQDVLILNGVGELWHSESISIDGFENLEIQENKLRGRAWLRFDRWGDFSVDLVTKEVTYN